MHDPYTAICEQDRILTAVVQHLAYYRRLCALLKGADCAPVFLVHTANGHLLATVIGWSMVFGCRKEKTHWCHVVPDDDRKRLVESDGIEWTRWESYHGKMVRCRNRFAVHRDIDQGWPAPPCFDAALSVVFVYDDWLREQGHLTRRPLRDLYQALSDANLLDLFSGGSALDAGGPTTTTTTTTT